VYRGVESFCRTPVFLDTSVVVAATVELHPSHAVAVGFVDDLISAGAPHSR